MTIYTMLAYWRGGDGGFAFFWVVFLLCIGAGIIAMTRPREGGEERTREEVAELRRELERVKSQPPKS
jgi:hypothetical protein